MKIMKASKQRKYIPEIGDILYGEDYFEKLDGDENKLEIFNLMVIDPNTWAVLAKFGIDIHKVQEAMTYMCPYLKQQYYWCVPYAIVGKDLSSIKELVIKALSSWHADYAMDKEFFMDAVQEQKPVDKWDLGDVTKLFLGSGYTDMTIISDGSRSKVRAKIPLATDDVDKPAWILVELWEWFNK